MSRYTHRKASRQSKTMMIEIFNDGTFNRKSTNKVGRWVAVLDQLLQTFLLHNRNGWASVTIHSESKRRNSLLSKFLKCSKQTLLLGMIERSFQWNDYTHGFKRISMGPWSLGCPTRLWYSLPCLSFKCSLNFLLLLPELLTTVSTLHW